MQWDVTAAAPGLDSATNLTAGVFVYDTGGGAFTQDVSNFTARVFKGIELSAARVGSDLHFSWNVAGPSGLQSNSDLSNPTGWVAVPGATNSPFTMPIASSGQTFFRVVLP